MNKPDTEEEKDQAQPQTESHEDWEARAKEYKDGWQRAQAELINYRKRADEEKQAFVKFAHADLLMQILPILDNFKRAAEHTPSGNEEKAWSNWASGVKAIEKQFELVIQNNGITEIPAKPGDMFDPNVHEALTSEQSDKEPDTILQVIEPGYMLNGRILRATKVKVSK